MHSICCRTSFHFRLWWLSQRQLWDLPDAARVGEGQLRRADGIRHRPRLLPAVCGNTCNSAGVRCMTFKGSLFSREFVPFYLALLALLLAALAVDAVLLLLDLVWVGKIAAA